MSQSQSESQSQLVPAVAAVTMSIKITAVATVTMSIRITIIYFMTRMYIVTFYPVCFFFYLSWHNSFYGYFLGNKDPRLPVTDEDIKNIPSHIVKVWRQLARALSLPENIVDSINIDYDTAYEKSYQMLRKWKQIKVSKANYETLATALQHPDVGRGDLIPKFC